MPVKKTQKKTEKPKQVKVTEIRARTTKIHLVSLRPYVGKPWTKEERRGLVEDVLKPKEKKEKKPMNPERDYRLMLEEFTLSDGTYGLPAPAVKEAVVRMMYEMDFCSMPSGRILIGVEADEGRLFRIKTPGPSMRGENYEEADIRFIRGAANPVWRPEFQEWEATITVRFFENKISLESLIRYLDAAGRFIGIGEMRPAKKTGLGTFGTFHVVRDGKK